jgi:hypothetical protein
MKHFLISLLIFVPLSASAKPVSLDFEDFVIFNPQPICADLIGIPRNSDNFGYDQWQNFQKCIQYFHSVDGTYH